LNTLIVLFAWNLPVIKKINSLFLSLAAEETTLALSNQQGNNFTKALLDYENYSAKIPSCQALFQKTGQRFTICDFAPRRIELRIAQ